MQTRHESILRSINRNGKGLNILTYPIHESFQKNWEHLQHTFYLFRGDGIKNWDNTYRQMPENHILLDGGPHQIKLDMKYDIVLNQNKAHYSVSRQFAENFNIPLVSLEHTLPFYEWNDKYIKQLTSKLRGQTNCYISKYSVEKWHDNLDDPSVRVVHHAIETDKFTGGSHEDDKVLTVVNDWSNRDWCCGWNLYNEVIKGFPANPVGNTPGFSEAAKNTKDLVSKYQNASVFLNTSLISPVPMALLEAMSCGCAVVSAATCMIPEIIIDGENGFLFDPKDIKTAREKVDTLLKDKNLREKMGNKARQTIIDKFSLDKHLSAWDRIFNEVAGKGFYNG